MLCFNLPWGVERLQNSLFPARAWRTKTAIVATAALCPILAVLQWVVGLLVGSDLWNRTCWYTLYYGVVLVALMGIPRDSWRRLEDIAPSVEGNLRDPDDQLRLRNLVDGAIRRDLQILVGMIGFGTGVVGGAFAANAQGVAVSNAIPFELGIGLTVLLQSNVVMWSLCGYWWVGFWACRPSLRFDAYDPLRSPGLCGVYGLLDRGQWYLTGGLVLVIVPLVSLYNDARDSEFMRVVVAISAIGAFVVVVLAFVVPPLYLRRARIRDKQALLNELHAEHAPKFANVAHAQPRLLEPALFLYTVIQARATGGVDANRLTNLAVALISLAAAFAPLLLAKN